MAAELEFYRAEKSAPGPGENTAENQQVDWLKDSNSAKSTAKQLSSNCKPSPEYQAIIEKLAQNFIEPEKIGNKEELKNRFNCQIHSTEDAHKYAREVLESLDKNSTVHTPEEFARIRERMGEGFGGIGATVTRQKGPDGLPVKNGPAIVERLVKGAPAEKAGIVVGDRITKINGEDITNKTLDQTIRMIRGEKGTSVSIELEGKLEPIEITRDKIVLPAVEDKILPGNIAYLRLNTFEKDSAALEMGTAVAKHANSKGIILDLRGNMGGRDLTAYLVSSLFLKEGVIHRTKTRIESPSERPVFENLEVRVNPYAFVISSNLAPTLHVERFQFQNKPTVVLMDGLSASASEIVIGALQDNKAATVIGTKSFGKGDGQRLLFNFPEGGMTRITGSKGYTPNGHWFGNGNDKKFGREPDIKVENPKGTEYGSAGDLQMKAAMDFLSKK